jgi:signal transduction histidine kinase
VRGEQAPPHFLRISGLPEIRVILRKSGTPDLRISGLPEIRVTMRKSGIPDLRWERSERIERRGGILEADRGHVTTLAGRPDGRRPLPSREKLMTALGRLVRTTAFKLSFAYLVIFTVIASTTLAYVAWSAQRVLDEQFVSTIEAEINGLAEQYRNGGLRRLVAVIERRSRMPGASLYLVTTNAGERIAGNVGALPPGVLDRPGQFETAYGLTDESDETASRAIVRVYLLPGGFRLLVGRDIQERGRLREVIQNAFGYSLLLIGILGCAGGWFIARRILKRVDDMTETTRTIMAGDLSGRIRVAGTGDELDRLAENLNAMLDRIGELMTGLREVSDNIAHDLKTPLTRLRNKADEALRTARSPDELKAALEANIEESDNLIRVFNALLMIARLESDSAREALADFDAAEAVRDMAELYEAHAEEAGVPLETAVEGNLPVHGSRELLGQAVANLLDNALKYGAAAEPGEPAKAVTISARREGDHALIAIADRGSGIPEAERGRVLERFVRLESARSRPGFGLGLSLAAAVARLHGGTLRLEDHAPGLKAVLELPLREQGPPRGEPSFTAVSGQVSARGGRPVASEQEALHLHPARSSSNPSRTEEGGRNRPCWTSTNPSSIA